MRESHCFKRCYAPSKVLSTFGIAIGAVFVFGSSSFAAPPASKAPKSSVPKVTICHIPPGNPNNPQTLTVGTPAVAFHLAHGDVLGACASQCPTSCDDNNRCTYDTCDSTTGQCVHTPITPSSCDDGNPCTVDSCDVASGSCVNTSSSVTNGLTCDDLNECTVGETCSNGVCRGGTSVPNCCRTATDCDHISCKTASCSNRQCVYTDKACGADPNNPNCTVGICFNDACEFADKNVCVDDLNACTDQSCNPATGTCATINDNANACSDNNACTQTDACVSGSCVGGNPITCSASDQCHTAGTCNPTTGVCSNPAQPDGTLCFDEDICTSDACLSGVCTSTPIAGCIDGCIADFECNDNNNCSLDKCQAGTCTHAPILGCGSCDLDGGGCGISCTSDADCNDGDSCTNDSCLGGSCAYLTIPDCGGGCGPEGCGCTSDAECNDGDPCTTDFCGDGFCLTFPIPLCTP